MGAVPEQMVSYRKVPWHKQGDVVSEPIPTAKKAMEMAGLDIPVTNEPVYVNSERLDGPNRLDGENREVTYVRLDGYRAIIRDDDRTVFQIATDAYRVVQNHEVFAFFDKLVEGKTLSIETAFELKHGAIVCLSAMLNREFLVGGVDKMLPYVVGVNSHNSEYAFGMHITPVRPECENLLNLAIGQASASWKAKHTNGVESQITEASKTLGIVESYYDEFEAEANRMIATELDKREFERIIRVAFPKGKPIGGVGGFTPTQYQLIGTFESSATIDDSFRYTQWGALNAVGEHLDWSRRSQDGDESGADSRALNSLLGDAPKGRQRFYDAMVAS
jgi:phage/plasmid-like protein (TIGR03299 family)